MFNTLLTLVILLAGCGRYQSQSTPSESTAHAVSLGEGYDLAGKKRLGLSCIKWSPSSEDVIMPKIGEYKYETNIDYAEVLNALNARLEVGLEIGAFTFDGAFQYAKEFKNSQYQSSLNIVVRSEAGHYRINAGNNVSLNALGEEAAARLAPNAFYSACGEEYVQEISLGASFLTSLIFEFSSMSDKMAFDAMIDINYGTFGGTADISVIMEQASIASSVRMIAYQRGGDPGKLNNILSSEMAECSIANRAACNKAFEIAANYVKTGFYDQFKVNGEYVSSRFEAIGFTRNVYQQTGNPLLNDLVIDDSTVKILLAAREKLAIVIQNDQSDLAMVTNQLSLLLPEDSNIKPVAEGVIAKIGKRLDLYKEAERICTAGIQHTLRCKNIVDDKIAEAASLYPYDLSTTVSNRIGFIPFCTRYRLWHKTFHMAPPTNAFAGQIMDEDSVRSLTMILNLDELRTGAGAGKTVFTHVSGATGTDITPSDEGFDCYAYFSQISLLMDLDLSGKGLYSMAPLSAFPFLRQINLSHNKFVNGVSEAKLFPYLEMLSVASSHLTSLDGIFGKFLRDLDVSSNGIENGDLKQLSDSPALERLNIGNNVIDDLAGLPDLKKLLVLDISRNVIGMTEFMGFLGRVDAGEFRRLREVVVSGELCGVSNAEVQIICN